MKLFQAQAKQWYAIAFNLDNKEADWRHTSRMGLGGSGYAPARCSLYSTVHGRHDGTAEARARRGVWLPGSTHLANACLRS